MNKIYIMVKWWKNEVTDVKVYKTYDDAWNSIKENQGKCYAQIFEREIPR